MEVTSECDSSFHHYILPLFLFLFALHHQFLSTFFLFKFLIVMRFSLSLHLLHCVHLFCLFVLFPHLSLCLFSYPPPPPLKRGQCSRGFYRHYTLYIPQETRSKCLIGTVQSGREDRRVGESDQIKTLMAEPNIA